MKEELPLYQVIDWDKHFENFRSRAVDRCLFVCVPNKHGGAGLANVQGELDGAANYGVWVWILELCSRHPKPRQGYLTADGSKDGRRYSVAELARLFRRPQSEIRRCLHVMCSPGVAWMKHVEGAAEPIPAGYPDDSEAMGDRCVADGEQMHGGDDERRNGKKESLSKQPIKDDEKPIENRGSINDQTMGERCSTDGEAIQHKEAKELFGKLSEVVFGEARRENQWPYEEEQWLDEALPLSRDNWALIDWFYRLRENHEIFSVTRRRQSLRSLIQHLKSEPQKIRSARKVIGLNGLHADSDSDEQWTQARLDAAKEVVPRA
jgi:hypothetical protein